MKKMPSAFVPVLVLMPGLAVILQFINQFNAEFMPSWYLPIGTTVQVMAFGVVLLSVPKMEPLLFTLAWLVLLPAMLGFAIFVSTGDPNFFKKIFGLQ